MELWLRNLIRPEEFPYKVASGIVWDCSGFVESLTSACAAIGYAKLRDEQAKARDEGRLAGIGIATYAELRILRHSSNDALQFSGVVGQCVGR